MIKKIFIIFCIGLVNPFNSFAQKHILRDQQAIEIVKNSLNALYNFNFDKNDSLNLIIKTKFPNHPAYDFMNGLTIYWKMIQTDDFKNNEKAFENAMVATINKSKKLLDKNSKDQEAIFFKLAAEAYTALFFSERNNLSELVSYAKKAYGTLSEAYKYREELNEFYFPTGLYQYYVVQYPTSRPFIKPFMIFFKKGNKELGLKELDFVWRNTIFSKMECGYHLANIYLKYENKPEKAYTYTSVLNKNFPNNQFFTLRHIESLLAAKEYSKAEILCYNLYKTSQLYFKGTASVMYGHLFETRDQNYSKAEQMYLQAIKYFKNTENPEVDYLSMAYAGLGRIEFQKNNIDKAIEWYKKCKEIAEYTSVIKETESFLDKND